ncbi:MAG: hypothetical protein VKJ64_02165 [Leptolyngbyaceae bacterium]|nr:hypothetical protein [Leptolyngbyaceae bacterium]
MTNPNPNPNLQAQARQGQPQAIATLLNRFLQSRNIRAQVRRRDAQLLIQLTSDAPLDQQAIASQIMRGLQRLEVQGIEVVQLQARQPEATALTWRIRIPWPTPAPRSSTPAPATTAAAVTEEPPAADNSPSDQDHPTNPAPPSPAPPSPAPPSPPAGIAIAHLGSFPAPVVLPGWSFWFGWVLVAHFATVLAYAIRHQGSASGLNYGLYFASLLLGHSLRAIGQWFVLRQEVAWAKTWLEATIMGAIASSLLQLLVAAFELAHEGRTPLPLSLIFGLVTIAPIALMQWAVLRRAMDRAHLWLGAIAGITAFSILIRTIRPLYISIADGLPLLTMMATGAMMVYLLRRSPPENLHYNRITDGESRQRLLQQRQQVNGLFFLEWVGWTLLGWAVGSVIQTIVSFLGPAIMVGAVTFFQAIALKRRIDGLQNWWKNTVITAIAFPLIGGMILTTIVLLFGESILQNLGQLNYPGAGAMPFFALMGLGILVIIIGFMAVIVVQSKMLKRYGYRSHWWFYTHIAMILNMMAQVPRGSSGIFVVITLMVLVPAATIVWMLGYPKSLHRRLST